MGPNPVVQYHPFWRFFPPGIRNPFSIRGSFSALALHWRFSRRSMFICNMALLLYGTHGGAFFTKTALMHVLDPIFSRGVVILVWGRYILSVLPAEVTKTRYPRQPTPATGHRGALRYTWRISPINSSMSKFGGFSLSLCGISWFSPFYLLDTGLSQAFDISATIVCFSRMRYPSPATANKAVGYNTVS